MGSKRSVVRPPFSCHDVYDHPQMAIAPVDAAPSLSRCPPMSASAPPHSFPYASPCQLCTVSSPQVTARHRGHLPPEGCETGLAV
jgi:hypothetical protein